VIQEPIRRGGDGEAGAGRNLPPNLVFHEPVQCSDEDDQPSYAKSVELYREEWIGSEIMHATSVT
jgi:hypothetical protein